MLSWMYGSPLEAVHPSMDVRFFADLLKMADTYDVPGLDPDIAASLRKKCSSDVTTELGPIEEIFALPKQGSLAVRKVIADCFEDDIDDLIQTKPDVRDALDRIPELAFRILKAYLSLADVDG